MSGRNESAVTNTQNIYTMVVKTQQLNTPIGTSADCTDSTQREQRRASDLKVFQPRLTRINRTYILRRRSTDIGMVYGSVTPNQ